MKTLTEIENRLLEMRDTTQDSPVIVADELLILAEDTMCHWLKNSLQTPTNEKREGFRLLALHRQGCKGDPSFNACRETCRELVYYSNLIKEDPDHPQVSSYISMAVAVAYHICLFIDGKLIDRQLGDFCCSSKPLRTEAAL